MAEVVRVPNDPNLSIHFWLPTSAAVAAKEEEEGTSPTRMPRTRAIQIWWEDTVFPQALTDVASAHWEQGSCWAKYTGEFFSWFFCHKRLNQELFAQDLALRFLQDLDRKLLLGSEDAGSASSSASA